MAKIEEKELEGHRGEIIADVKKLVENIVQYSIGTCRISIKLLRISSSRARCVRP